MPRKVPKRKPKAPRPRKRAAAGKLDLDALLSSPEIMALLGPDDADPPPDDPSGPAVAPGLMALALACLVEDAQASGSGDILYAATRAYAAYHGKDDANPVAEAEVPRIAELARRLSAAGGIVQDLDLPAGPDPDRLLVIAAAACTAPLVESGPQPAFERAGFVAAMERAKAAMGK